MPWSAEQYSAFEDERTRPVRDLLAQLGSSRCRAATDVGCGPGNSTEVLASKYPDARISGFDSSSDMIQAARSRLPHIEFTVNEVTTWSRHTGSGTAPVDVILANAVLQWVPDHSTLLPALIAKLAPGGCLALQMPDNLDGPAHRAMRELAADGPWADKLKSAAAARPPLASPAWYYAVLSPLCSAVDIWRTTYHHPLSGAAAIVDWFKGTGLRPFLEPLDAGETAVYLERYTSAIERLYPASTDGCVLLPFPRLFMVARRGAGG